jgi:hypothetical protein
MRPLGIIAYEFLAANPAANFYSGPAPPGSENFAPAGQVRIRQ